MVNESDEDPANLKTVAVFPLQNAEPQDAMQVLSDIFKRDTTRAIVIHGNQNNPLNTRTTQQNRRIRATELVSAMVVVVAGLVVVAAVVLKLEAKTKPMFMNLQFRKRTKTIAVALVLFAP